MRNPRTRPAGLAAALVAILLLASNSPSDRRLHAQDAAIDPGLYGTLKWRSIGPLRGGRSIAVSGSAARVNEYYFGATGGGLWKTTDGGTTWLAAGDGQFRTSSVGAVAVAPSNPDVVYVGFGESALRGNIIQGDGVYRTTDGGKTFEHIGLADTQTISRIVVHPANPDVAYVAALGHAYGENAERGIFRTRDGGKHWDQTLFRDARTGAIDLSINPKHPDTLYATMWQVHRTPWSLESGGPGSGLFKSTDGGSTWTELTKNPGMPGGLWGRAGVSVSPADSNRVYALIENENGGVFVSDDAGATWKRVNEEPKLRQRAFYYSHIFADPQEKDTVYVLNVQFWKSVDGGKTFPTRLRTPHGDNHDLWIAPNDSRRMVEANDGGANVSVNGGSTWTDQDVPTAQFYNVFVTAHVPYHVCGAQQDNTTVCVSSVSPAAAGGGRLPAILYAVGGGESGYIAPDPTNPDVFYAGSYGGLLTRLDRSTGQQRAINIHPDNPMGWSSVDLKERFQWTFPIVFSPADRRTLYASSQHVWKTTDGGQSWKKISPNLARSDPKTLQASGGPITKDQSGVETYGVVFTIAPSHQDANTIWTGSDDGWVHVTRDGGKTWENVTPGELPEFTRIALIEASPHQNGVAYLAGNRYQLGDRTPYVYRTGDFGRTWTTITGGLPVDDFPRAIREDIKRRGLLYLGTEHGIYVSFDDGAKWQPLRLNLPVTPVHGIVSDDRDLVIGTHGRGFYVLDNIGVLRQASPELTSHSVHVFDTFMPLRGRDRNVSIDYYLAKDAGTVKIDILDASGTTIRSFTGERKEATSTTETAQAEEHEPEFASRRVAVGLTRGTHRIIWDLRREGAVTFPGMIMWAAQPQRGPISPPGRYAVRITADGVSSTREFRIGLDPRLTARGVTEGDLQKQFELASQVRDKVSEANRAVIRIRRIRDQVNDRVTRAADRRRAEVQAITDGLMKALTAVEEAIYQVRNRSAQDPLNYPIRLNNRIAALTGVIESADNRPTDQTYRVFDELSQALARQLRNLEATLVSQLPRVNAVLQRQRLAPIEIDARPAPPNTRTTN